MIIWRKYHIFERRVFGAKHNRVGIFVKSFQRRLIINRNDSDFAVFHFFLFTYKHNVTIMDSRIDHAIAVRDQNEVSVNVA